MTRGERGAALAETALVAGLAMLIIFNGIELAMFGFYQLHADATAFASARYVASGGDEASAPGADFPPQLSTTISWPFTNTAQAVVTKDDAAALVMLPGAGPAVAQGEHQENKAVTSTGAIPPLLISESLERLVNYYATGTKIVSAPGTHNVCLAHSINASGGNGVNGAFKVWNDHAQTLSKAGQQFVGGSWSTLTLSPAFQRGAAGYSSYQSTIDGWDATATACSGT